MTSIVPEGLRENADILFGNLHEIYTFHSETFLKDLENCISETELVACCFVQRVSYEDFQFSQSEACLLHPYFNITNTHWQGSCVRSLSWIIECMDLLTFTARRLLSPVLVLLPEHSTLRPTARDARRHSSVLARMPEEIGSQASARCLLT